MKEGIGSNGLEELPNLMKGIHQGPKKKSYSSGFRRQIVEEVKSLGRGGQTKVGAKYGINPSLISNWSKGRGTAGKFRSVKEVPTPLTAMVDEALNVKAVKFVMGDFGFALEVHKVVDSVRQYFKE